MHAVKGLQCISFVIVQRETDGGGAVHAFGKAKLGFEECQFVGNGGRFANGGALHFQKVVSLAIKGCSFLGNTAVCL